MPDAREPSEPPLTWADRIANLRKALGRKPTLEEMLLLVPMHNMTAGEIQAQRESWARGMRPTGEAWFD